MWKEKHMSGTPDEIEIDDDELELAAGGIILSKNPSQTGNSSDSYNSTIYFQASTTDTIT